MAPRDLIAIAMAIAGCKRHEPKPAPAPVAARPRTPDAIPQTTGAIKIDGEWDESDWPNTALRGQFRGDDGDLARPSSEVRFLHDDHDLFVALYAADENVQSSDRFELTVGTLALRLDATGAVQPPTAGVRAAADRDGTLDDPKDDDEEWVVEVAIPLAATGLAPGVHVPVTAARCDVTKDGVQRCGRWSASLTVE